MRGTVTEADTEATYAIVSAKDIKGLKELYIPETLRYLGSFDGCSTLERSSPYLSSSLTMNTKPSIFGPCACAGSGMSQTKSRPPV